MVDVLTPRDCTAMDDREIIAEGRRLAAYFGRTYLPHVVRALCDRLERALDVPPALASRVPIELEALSPREREVLAQLLTDASPNDIAENLEISFDTVKTHRRRIFKKLGVSRRWELLARARAA